MTADAHPVGRLAAIWIKQAHGGPMDRVSRAQLSAGRGLIGNADQGGRRQVTLIEAEVWQELRAQLGPALEPTARRANLLVRAVSLAHSCGRVLRVGTCRLRIGGETRPCERMEAACPGLRSALEPDWRAGAFAEVLDDGAIAVGDVVHWED